MTRIAARKRAFVTALEYLNQYHASGGPITGETALIEFEACRGLHKNRQALATGEVLLKMHPDNTDLLMEMASLLADDGNYQGALGCLYRARDADRESATVRKLIAEYEEKKKRARIDELAKMVAEHPDGAQHHEELGDLYHDFGQWNDAIVAYQRAALSRDLHDIASAKLGYVLACKGMFAEAQEAFNEAGLRIDQPADEQKKVKALLFSAAEIMETEKHTDLALGLYKRVFRVDAGYRDVVGRIERLQRTEKPRK
jgi:tetratricopeptide (TPR) repeat protein